MQELEDRERRAQEEMERMREMTHGRRCSLVTCAVPNSCMQELEDRERRAQEEMERMRETHDRARIDGDAGGLRSKYDVSGGYWVAWV